MRISFKSARKARVPEGTRIYAIGDVHGRADLLSRTFLNIDAHLGANSIARPVHVLVGDYIDRGPNSKEVLDLLVQRGQSHEMICLKGNHESYLAEFLTNPMILEDWRQYGALETLVSYGLRPAINPGAAERIDLAKKLADVFPEEHRKFLDGLPLTFSCGDFFFVHAGVRPGVPLSQQRQEDLLWIRNEFLLCETDFGKIIVHGHTPVRAPEIHANRVNIDTGAYATGKLTCLILETEEVVVL